MSRRKDPRHHRNASKTRLWPAPSLILILILLAMAWAGSKAEAGITEYDSYKSVFYTQSGDASPSPSSSALGAFYTARVFFDGPGQASSVYGVLGGTTPLIYSGQSDGSFLYQTTFYSSPSAMDSDFTPGLSDKVALSGGSMGYQTASFTLAADSYAATVPSLIGGSDSALQGMNAGAAATLNFSGFSPGSGVNEADTFVTILRNSDGAVVYSSGGLSNTTTSLILAANTLAHGMIYTVDLDYSSRIDTFNAGFAGATLVQAFDNRTEIAFFTGSEASVPEPSSVVMTALGASLLGLGYRLKRRRSL